MKDSWKIHIARSAIRQSEPEDMMALIDAVLPAVVETLPKPQLKAFIKRLFRNHLKLLVRDLDYAERKALLENLLPIICEAFPLQDVDLSCLCVAEISRDRSCD